MGWWKPQQLFRSTFFAEEENAIVTRQPYNSALTERILSRPITSVQGYYQWLATQGAGASSSSGTRRP